MHCASEGSYPLAQEQTADPTSLDIVSGQSWQAPLPFVGLKVPLLQAVYKPKCVTTAHNYFNIGLTNTWASILFSVASQTTTALNNIVITS